MRNLKIWGSLLPILGRFAGPGGVEPPVRVLETRGLPLTDGPILILIFLTTLDNLIHIALVFVLFLLPLLSL